MHLFEGICQNPLLTTGELAARFGVSHNTIRNWCREFGPHLSPSANPRGKQQRRFTARDAEVLAKVSALRVGPKPATQQEIQDALDSLAFGEVEVDPEPPPEAEPTSLVTQAHVEALTMLLQRETQRADDLQRRIEDLQRELGRLEGAQGSRRKPPPWWTKLFGGRSD